MKKIVTATVLLLLTSFIFAAPAHASVFDDIVKGVKNTITGGVDKVKNILNKDEVQSFSITSKIELATNGDINKNNQIDAGDSVTFSYVITNPTNTSYKATTLNTNVSTKEINSITNIQGVLSLDSTNDTIIIPHLHLEPNQVRKFSFDARINFNKDTDQMISTQAELVGENNTPVFKAQKNEVKAQKMNPERFNKSVHITK